MNIIFNSPFYHWFYLQPHCAVIWDDLCCNNLDSQFYLILGPAFFFLACPRCAAKLWWAKSGKKRSNPRIVRHGFNVWCLHSGFFLSYAPKADSSQALLSHSPSGPGCWDQVGSMNPSASPSTSTFSDLFPYLYQLIFDAANNSLFQLLFAACVGLW